MTKSTTLKTPSSSPSAINLSFAPTSSALRQHATERTKVTQGGTSVLTVRMAAAKPAVGRITIDEARRSSSAQLLLQKSKWRDEEYRTAYAETSVDQGIAWQLRVNREMRGLTQREFATLLGTRQSAVSRMENPEYGSHSLPQLKEVAHAFKCALLVKLVPYSALARESFLLSERDLYVRSYDDEIKEIENGIQEEHRG